MQAANFTGRRFLSLPLLLLIAAPSWAAPASDTLLPKTTKGYLSVAHPKDFEDRWNKTQLGLMFTDDTMQAFESDLRKQMSDEFGAAERKLGVTFNDLKGVTGGELSLSIIERKSPDATMAITINVAGHQKEADGLLARIERSFAKRGGKKTNSKVGDTTLIVFDIPAEKSTPKQQTVYFLKDDLLCGADDRGEVEAMLKRFDGKATDNLKSVPAYVATMAKCSKEAGQLEPEARWFVEPFGFIFAARTLRSSQHHGQDMAKILYDNGFDAIQGAGGYVNQLVDGHIEYLLRASVYAPPVKGKENDPLRWNLSMRMMQLPNGPAVEPESWVPRMVASYSTMNVSLVDAFDNIGPLFDAVQEHEDAWKNTLEGWTTDPYGPQVDVRKEFIGNLTNRVSVITNYDTPITEDSERSVFAIEAKDEVALGKTLDKWMKNERDVKRREIGQYIVWERTAKSNVVEEPEVEVPGFSTSRSNKSSKNAKKDHERVLPNSAVTVALGHLMLASDVAYLTEVLEGFAQRERLASSADYKQLTAVMDKLAPGDRSGWGFGRGDEEVRPVFEMVRQNRMPESKSMLGKMLNNLLTTDADRKSGSPRKQRVDGSSLPEFESVRRYFGPHADAVHSEKDGWFVTAAVLNTDAP